MTHVTVARSPPPAAAALATTSAEAGEYHSADFPTTAGAFDTSWNGDTLPLVVQQSVTASQLSVSTLANVQHWWRVGGQRCRRERLVRCADLHTDGIDLRVREHAGRLEYDLMLAPGTDAARVVVRAEGASSVGVAPDGSLVLHTSSGILRQTPPVTWEVLPDGTRQSREPFPQDRRSPLRVRGRPPRPDAAARDRSRPRMVHVSRRVRLRSNRRRQGCA